VSFTVKPNGCVCFERNLFFSIAWREIQIHIHIRPSGIPSDSHTILKNRRTEELKSRRTEERTEREKNDTFDVNAVAPYASDPVFGFGAGLGIHGGVGVVD